MTIDFQQVHDQVKQLGEKTVQRFGELQERRRYADRLLSTHASNFDQLLQRLDRITHQFAPNLRCAAPAADLSLPPETLNFHAPLPPLPRKATLLAADGSQINPDRHEQVNFGLINVGIIRACLGQPDPPKLIVETHMLFDEALYTSAGVISEAQMALMRDLHERASLVEQAKNAAPPVISFTDGPMELWGGREAHPSQEFKQSLEKYLEVLREICASGVITAGYVDKPSADLVVRLLEVASLSDEEISDAKNLRPLQGVSDRYLFQGLLQPGERSAVFAIRSRSALDYKGELALHFFYLNVGRFGKPWLARIEIPAWVAGNPLSLQNLHAVLFHQCQIMGNRPFPYLIHRAHEIAVVTKEEKEQVAQMIVAEHLRRGVPLDEMSYKQSAKELKGRTRYER